MNITEIRVKLVGNNSDRLKAFCSITLDGAFVVRDLKVIEGINGPFVAMPSRKMADRCPKCSAKNHLRARFCNECGVKLDPERAPRDEEGRIKLHADVAHPINMSGREQIQKEVIAAFQRELESAAQPGYKPSSLEDDDYGHSDFEDLIADLRGSTNERLAKSHNNRERSAAPHPGPPPSSPQRPPAPDRQPPPPSREKESPVLPKQRSAPAEDGDPFSAGII